MLYSRPSPHMEVEFRMRPALRRAVLLGALVTSMSAAARAQTVCDQLLPIGVTPPAGGFASGCMYRYVLRRSSSSESGSTYIPLAFPACANGPCAGLTAPNQFICEATNGYSCCISVSDSIPLVIGNYAGPLRQGLDRRMANDTDPRSGICYSDYVGNGSRVAHVPLIHPTGTGSSQTQVAGFLRLFLTGPLYGNSDLVVEFVSGPTPVRNASWGRTKVLYR